MMSQISKNSAGMNSAAVGAESTLLFGQTGIAASPNMTSVIDSGVAMSTNIPLAGPKSALSQPGVLNLNPSMVASMQQQQQKSMPPPGLTANQIAGAVSTGTELDGGGPVAGAAGATAPSLSSSLSTSQQSKAERLQQAQLQQQFEQLQLIGETCNHGNLANTKEKTPMCLINELARFNKVQHQYTLMDEQGPAHKKTFYVKLKLGDEDYSALGPSIKKAQHAAAASALSSTKLKHPPPKPPRPMSPGNANSVTPTVELNALAMKRGEPAIYKPIEPRHPPYYPPMDFRGMYNQRYHYPRMPRLFYTSLKVGPREFIGEGPTRQAARHMAATKALKVLRNLPLPSQTSLSAKQKEETTEPDLPETEVDAEDQLKSEISLVHEIALKRNLEVKFEVTRESGPPHMKVFVTQCTVGDYKTEAQGNSKKLSKKQAAEMMLHELRHLPTISMVSIKQKPKPANNKKKNRNLVKVDTLSSVQKADVNYGVGINPISRLIQIMQAQKKKEPVYSLIAERGLPRRREFVMQVCVDEQTCTGVGPNKKLAKRSAAEAMLEQLGFSRPSPQPSKPALKSGYSDLVTGDKKVTFSDADNPTGIVNGKGGRQLMPGLLFLPDSNLLSCARQSVPPGLGTGASAGGDNPLVSNLLSGHAGLRPEQQLIALATAHNIQVDFDDFSGKECLCRITLSNNPNHTVHGTGTSKETARDAASLAALKQLAETSLMSGTMKSEKTDQMGGGDGPQVQTSDIEKLALSTTLAGTAPVVKSDTM